MPTNVDRKFIDSDTLIIQEFAREEILKEI